MNLNAFLNVLIKYSLPRDTTMSSIFYSIYSLWSGKKWQTVWAMLKLTSEMNQLLVQIHFLYINYN